MWVLIHAGSHAAGDTERMYDGVSARIVSTPPDSPFIVVSPSRIVCPLVTGNIIVRKDCTTLLK